MEKREKIKRIYEKYGASVAEDYLDEVMKDKERIKALMRVYKDEEIDSMNYIFGKSYDNKYFTEFELQVASKINLFNRKVVEWCKLIWSNKDNEENLNEILNALNERKCLNVYN